MKKCAAHMLLLLLPLLSVATLAQHTLEEEDQPDLRRYTVEIIIFSYAQNVATGSEIFPPDSPPEIEIAVDGLPQDDLPVHNSLESVPEVVIAADVGNDAEETADAEEKPYELVMLPAEEFTLLEIYEHLERLDAYEPLMHFGWTQPTYPNEEVTARPLSWFATPPAGLEGELTLYLSRYLHLAIKLQLDDNDATRDGYFGFVEDASDNYPVRYRIDEDRIFRNGELRYFDHPKFGVLAKITRVEEAEPDASEFSDDMEMLGD